MTICMAAVGVVFAFVIYPVIAPDIKRPDALGVSFAVVYLWRRDWQVIVFGHEFT